MKLPIHLRENRYMVLLAKTESSWRKLPVGKPRYRWEDNIKVGSKVIF
jgi:hypothetical protein